MRIIATMTIAMLLATSSAPLPTAALASQGEEAADAEAVCAPFLEGFRQDDRRRYAPNLAPPPVPPPAPPPPVPPASGTTPDAGSPITVLSNQEVRLSGTVRSEDIINSLPQSFAQRSAGDEDRERYAGEAVATIRSVREAPVSTFGVDVDTGSYANVRRMLLGGAMPPQEAVRTEEMLNYFRYDYPAPADRARPFTVSADVTLTPWNAETRLLRIGLRGYDVERSERPPANLVFLVDVSGSMDSIDKLPLVQCSLALLARRLQPSDRVSIVVYAGAAGMVLEPTADKDRVLAVLSRLKAGGSTAGAEGIRLAYRTARAGLIEGGINRVILATDGDFNVGVTDDEALIGMVEREREAGITLTTLGFGTGNYNEAMMEQVADRGNGNYAYIDSPREAQKVLDDELSSTLFTIAKDVKIQVEFNPAHVSEYRLIGYENRALAEQDFDNDAVDSGDIGAGHQVTALYELVPAGAKGWLPERRYPANRGRAAAAGGDELGFLRLRYKLPGGSRSQLIERPLPARLLGSASAPGGDTAFAAAVAAFGQKLRGDKWLNGFGFADARSLAAGAGASGYWRREFLRLTELAERLDPATAPRGGSR